MNILVLMGSPRLHGNTAELCKPFIKELQNGGAAVRYETLADKSLAPCKGCYACQDIDGSYGCAQHDAMQPLIGDVLWADCLVLATPIYSWYCPTAMKTFLDRSYGLNKFYGSAHGSLWAGKRVAILATHGYDRAYATEPFETGVRRLCEHSSLAYIGLYSVRDLDNIRSFRTTQAVDGAKEFARQVLLSLKAPAEAK